MHESSSNLLYGFFHVLHGVGSYEGMQRLVLSWQHLSIFPADFALFHRTFTSDHDLGTALFLDVLQCVTTEREAEGQGEKPDSLQDMKNWVKMEHDAYIQVSIYRGPISSPTKLISGYSSCGIITLSLTLVAGGLQETNRG